MPVAAVIFAGSPTVSAGSEITIAGSIFGWKMIFLVWVASLVITEARPTSEPLLADHQRHRLGGVECAAAAEGDDAVMPAGAIGGEPILDVARDGVALDVAEQAGRQPGCLVGGNR